MIPALQLKDLAINIADTSIVNNISFDLKTGELGCLLGATGSGKTTILRAIAGFLPIAEGEIRIGEQLMSGYKTAIPPERRYCGIVFQDYNLFPHLTVRNNITYGLKYMSQANIIARTEKLLTMTRLNNKSESYPHELSGGERQRAALARAMAPSPRVILLDEPFASQDANLRESLASEVRDLLKTERIAGVLVTHEQSEAFALADKIGVLENGKIVQWDDSYNLYHKPKNRYVAEFIGQGTTVKGVISSWSTVNTALGQIKAKIDPTKYKMQQSILVFLRPDDVEFDTKSQRKAEVKEARFRGSTIHYTLESLDTLEEFYCHAPSHHVYYKGDKISYKLNVKELIVFADTGGHPGPRPARN